MSSRIYKTNVQHGLVMKKWMKLLKRASTPQMFILVLSPSYVPLCPSSSLRVQLPDALRITVPRTTL